MQIYSFHAISIYLGRKKMLPLIHIISFDTFRKLHFLNERFFSQVFAKKKNHYRYKEQTSILDLREIERERNK